MKLLIVTQKVDREDPILGFFHGWIEEFAKNCEQVTVIGQMVGDYSLPDNVKIVSLKKEAGHSIPFQIVRFWHLQWILRKQYDVALVHMTPIWIVLGVFPWLLLRKKMHLWYEARGKRWPLKASLLFVQKVFSASQSGVPLSTKKHHVMGHGISTDVFAPDGAKDNRHIITVGRLTRAKRIEFLMQSFFELSQEYRLSIIGGPLTSEDKKIDESLHREIAKQNAESRVSIGTLSQDALRKELQSAELFIHASKTPMDKALLEAMASGCLVLTTSDAFTGLPEVCKSTDAAFITDMQKLLSLSTNKKDEIRNTLREIIIQQHSLPQLIESLLSEMSTS